MPELPEVETVCRQLQELVAGRIIHGSAILDSKLKLSPKLLSSKKIISVHRVGKLVMFDLASSGRSRPEERTHLAVHLRMTGRLIWNEARKGGKKTPKGEKDGFHHAVKKDQKHLRASFALEGGELLFYDPRRFGTIEYFPSAKHIPKLGADPMTDSFSSELLRELMGGRKQPLKHWLLRQDAVCGIGNIYASEILFRAKLSPFRAAGSLEQAESIRLYRAIRQVLREAIKRCGTTFSDFQDSNGEEGGFAEFLRVYDREGLKCRTCRDEILRSTQSGRSTYYCASCQADLSRR